MSEKLKILVIDDQRIIGDLFEITLGYRGHDITAVETDQAALELIKSENFDIVFLDIVMPNKDGVELLREMREVCPNLSVIMMSGYSIEEKKAQAVQSGALKFLRKPFELEDLRQAVKEAIGKDL